MANSGFKMDISSMMANLVNASAKQDIALRMFAETAAIKLQNEARENARWTDRTGDARKRLTGSSVRVARGFKLILAHGVDYGMWLELAHEKKFSIIPETIDRVGNEQIMPGLYALLERMR